MTKCPDCGNTDNSKIAGVEIQGVYDGVLYWECWKCGHAFHRWEEGHHLRKRAQKWVDRSNIGT